ncbi:MAG: hypothetical protein QOK49_3594, partial [Baekduia sp.]|nr:hypothetical protein [Baekduia sp.]
VRPAAGGTEVPADMVAEASVLT